MDDILKNLNVRSLELLQGLNDDQRQIAAKLIVESERQRINPNFVLPVVMQESGFNPNAVSKAGAIGVMQLMPDTASGLKVDPHNVDQNIEGGIRLLKELSSNKKIGNDPIKILAAYNTSTATRNKFLESGDVNVLPEETLNYIINIAQHAGANNEGGKLPSLTFEPSSEEEEVPEIPQQPQPVVQNPTPQLGEESPVDNALLYGAAGHAAGTALGVSKVGAVKAARKIAEWANKPSLNVPDVHVDMGTGQTAPASVVRKQPTAPGGENWVEGLTGVKLPGGQMSKADLELAKSMQSAVGRNGEPGFTGGQITEGGFIISPQDAAKLQKSRELSNAAQQRVTDVNQRLNNVLQKRASQSTSGPSFMDNISGLLKYGSPEQRDFAMKALQKIKNTMNVTNLGSAGMGFGMSVPTAIAEFQKGEEGHPLEALGMGAGLGLASSLFPKTAPVVGTGLSALDVAQRAKNEDYTGAGLSAAGTVGPLVALSVLQPEIGIPLAVAAQAVPAAINTYRDYANWKQKKPTVGGGRGFVNPPLVNPDLD